jgi:hypothetical protein
MKSAMENCFEKRKAKAFSVFTRKSLERVFSTQEKKTSLTRSVFCRASFFLMHIFIVAYRENLRRFGGNKGKIRKGNSDDACPKAFHFYSLF